jgi:methionyl-tRNA synthetase
MVRNTVGTLIEKFELKNALAEVVEISRAGNQYLSTRAPWTLIKGSRGKEIVPSSKA